MEWNSQAVEEFIQMPLSDSAKSMAKVFAEKKARQNKSEKVTVKEIEATKKVYYASVPEEVRRKEWEKRIKEGESDLMEKVEKEAREILDKEIDLFNIEMCHAQYFRCGSQIAEVRKLREMIKAKLQEMKVTEMIADMLGADQRILPHDRITFSISACPNSCTGIETKEFGIYGTSVPVVTDIQCSECYACVEKCPDNAVLLIKGAPQIDYEKCKLCEACVRVCPTGTLGSEKTGYKLMVGGGFGRHFKMGFELFNVATEKELIKSIEACIEHIKENARGEESITSILTRTGVAPVFKKIFNS